MHAIDFKDWTGPLEFSVSTKRFPRDDRNWNIWDRVCHGRPAFPSIRRGPLMWPPMIDGYRLRGYFFGFLLRCLHTCRFGFGFLYGLGLFLNFQFSELFP